MIHVNVEYEHLLCIFGCIRRLKLPRTQQLSKTSQTTVARLMRQCKYMVIMTDIKAVAITSQFRAMTLSCCKRRVHTTLAVVTSRPARSARSGVCAATPRTGKYCIVYH